MPVYSDIATNFGLDGSPLLELDAAAVENNITNILNTIRGTYPWRRDIGSDLLPYVFDPANNATANKIRIFLLQSLTKYEPRIITYPQNTYITLLPTYDGYLVTVPYYIIPLNYSGVFTGNLVK